MSSNIPMSNAGTSRLLGDQDAVQKLAVPSVPDYGLGSEVDPLLLQLPSELQRFVRGPNDHAQKSFNFVKREPPYSYLHSLMACLCCPYSICRMTVVKQGQMALTQYGDEPELLGPGRHVLLAPWNTLVAIKDRTDQVIIHGPIHIIKVRRGELGYCVDMADGQPMLLSQGQHIIKSDTLIWKQFENLRGARTQLDQLEIIRVETGSIGYCYRAGELVILQPGLHLVQPPDRFGGIMSTQIAILDLPGDDYETSDYVTVTVRASLFYRIMDPKKALLRIQNVTKQLTETSVATLAGIIRSSSLSDVASRSQAFYHDPKKAEELKDGELSAPAAKVQIDDNPSAPAFYQFVHDEFIQTLADHVLEEWGIQIQNIRIESLVIADKSLQRDISSQAVEVTKQHNRYLMLQKQQEIIRVEAETRAARKRIDTMAETLTVREEAKAQADTVVIAAQAEKEALTLKGQGEAEFARLVESTALGRDLSMAKVQAEALAGLKQVAYVPHLPSLLGSGNGVFASTDLVLPKID